MNCEFCVVRIEFMYDEIAGVECLHKFDTETAASKYLSNMYVQYKKTLREKHNYIRRFVNNIEVPDLKVSELVDWFDKYPIDPCFPSLFRHRLRSHLLNGPNNNDAEIEGYDPPEVSLNPEFCYVMRV